MAGNYRVTDIVTSENMGNILFHIFTIILYTI